MLGLLVTWRVWHETTRHNAYRKRWNILDEPQRQLVFLQPTIQKMGKLRWESESKLFEQTC